MDDLFEHLMESERDKAINGFYRHFMIFLAVIAGLAIVNLVEGDSFWIQWVVLGWGAIVAYHAIEVFIRRPRREHEALEKRILAEEAAAAEPQSEQAETAPAGEEPGKSS